MRNAEQTEGGGRWAVMSGQGGVMMGWQGGWLEELKAARYLRKESRLRVVREAK
jgi:hypothetical protein